MCEFCSPDPKVECCVCGRKPSSEKKVKIKSSFPYLGPKRYYGPGFITRLFMGWFGKVYR